MLMNKEHRLHGICTRCLLPSRKHIYRNNNTVAQRDEAILSCIGGLSPISSLLRTVITLEVQQTHHDLGIIPAGSSRVVIVRI
jgi:hypothetical protein